MQNTQPTLYLDKILDLNNDGLGQTRPEVERLNEPDVDVYAWVGNTPEGAGFSGMGYTGGACDSKWNYKTSLTRGPSRGVIETAEVIAKTFKQIPMLSIYHYIMIVYCHFHY